MPARRHFGADLRRAAATMLMGLGLGAVSSISAPVPGATSIPRAFESLTATIAAAFDRDGPGLKYPRPLRDLVFETLTAMRGAMLVMVANGSRIDSASQDNASKVGSDFRLLQGLMRQDEASTQALLQFQNEIASVLPGGVRLDAADDPPALTGSALPRLLLDALEAVKPELTKLNPAAPLEASDVVLIKDVRRFGESLHVANEEQIHRMARLRMFVIANQPPIYVIEQWPDVLAAVALYQKGRSPYLRYTFGAMLAHEWLHAFLHERSEAKAYAFELQFLQRYYDQGLLPPTSLPEMENVQNAMIEAQRREAASGPDGPMKLVLKHP